MSAVFLDPSQLLHEINEYRMSRNMRYIMVSEFLTILSRQHCKDMIQSIIPFSLENINIRKNKLSSVVKNCQEILCRIGEEKSILDTIMNEPETKKILEGEFNLCGITLYRIAKTLYIHMIFAETY